MRVERKIIFILICIALFCPIVSAYYEVKQGDIVYAGEYVDISRVLSWRMQFAYWRSGYYGGDYPDKIIEVTGYMYSYYIDPQKYEPGTYWKWDGKEEGAGNNLAFVVKEGVRPEPTPVINNTTNKTPNGTINITPTPTMPELPLGEHVLIARGDDGMINYQLSDSKLINGKPQKAYLWLFGSTSKILGSPLESNSSRSNIYKYDFNSTLTQSLTEGKYIGYLQFVGNNNQQDVFYDPIKNTLDSPFKAIQPVNLDPFLPTRILHEFENMSIPSKYCDDYLVPITVDIELPSLTIDDYWEDGDTIMVEGSTNLAEGTDIVAMIDPDNFALPKEIAEHKFSTKATGNYSNIRKYIIPIPLKWDELSIGQHTIRISAQKYKTYLEVFKDFKVSGVWIMPTPTPELRKVLVEDYGTHQFPTKTPTLTPVPTQGLTPTPTTVQVIVNGTVRNVTPRNLTIVRPANWTPNNTTVIITPPPTPAPTRTPEPVPTDDIVLPLNPALVVFAIAIIGFILRRK
jgi:hypothetical protein